jgi:hypothetical protein
MTVPTRTTAIRMTTKIVPIVSISARDTESIGPLLTRDTRSKGRIGIGAAVIRITITTDASQYARKASLRASAGQAKRWLRGGLYVGR